MEFNQVIKKRRSTRKLLPKEVEEEKLQKILEAARSAPSAGNLQAYKIYVIKDQKIKNSLTQWGGGTAQDLVAKAPVSLVFCAAPAESEARYGERGESLYAIQDATIACCFAWLAAVDQGLSAVWIGAFDEEGVKETLNLDRVLRPIAILPIGYPAESPSKTPRKSLEELVEEI